MSITDYGGQGSVFLISSNGETNRLPVPSGSPNDPLGWSPLKSFLCLLSMSIFTTIGLILVQGTTLLLVPLATEYSPEEIAPFRLDVLSSLPSLFWGIGAVIWVPLSMAVGRRPVFIICTLLLTISTLMAALSQDFHTHLTARCLQGSAAAISPSSMILMILDIVFVHQRPRTIALYWCMCNATSNVSLAFTPYIVQVGGSWRAFYWLWLGPCFLTILLAVLWSPETYFARPQTAFDEHILSHADAGKGTAHTSSWEEVPWIKPMPDAPAMWRFSTFFKNILFWNRSTTGGWPAMKAFPQYLAMKLARHDKGVHEPEHYLPSFIVPVIISSISLALFGFGAEREWNWTWIVLLVGLNYFSAISMATSNVLWITEAFPRWAGAAITIVAAGGYGMSFVLGSTIVPWIESDGIGNTYLGLGMLTWVVGLIGFPIFCYGKRFREYIYSRWD
ncbi:uncharacterized protein RSE6_06150 [Rhynchosporium secalis]|uniref:Uncharacterized protein n=1 Tax=Rhynchosporium secalis TaxID=38038 RepID=A0A1E1M9N4_RHYSE|nr:uncharacterized protein RSE6_06150 [Rhynchosporium secalis]